ncbi:hypothetical protein ACIBEJ_41545 [Nonomuraea sp. NPDC050790]|uniref:hypothetical protein n=1 Tax=Nonomuraea sp. NPDC050790 TaxID=3364371 RepID=UPI00379F8392
MAGRSLTGMLTYLGSGPYCYTNSLAMALGEHAPPVAVIETLTGAAFGAQLTGGDTPYFDPYAWDPEIGLDAAMQALGWTCARTTGGTADEALARLRAAEGPVLAGPLDMGLLTYSPDGLSADHYVVVLAVDDDTVLLHDPEGFPYATLPVADFLKSWQGDSVSYEPDGFVMRTTFTRVREVPFMDALRDSLPGAARWLAGRTDLPVPPGTLGGAEAVYALADLVEAGLPPDTRGLLTGFAVRVGVHRLSDASACLALLGLPEAAAVARDQARLLGAVQYPLTTGDDPAAARALRGLAPTYARLLAELEAGR